MAPLSETVLEDRASNVDSTPEVAETESVSGFTALGLDPRVIKALTYTEPSPIQRESIPILLEGKDLVGLAGTGTGKTAAFSLPIVHRLAKAKRKGIAVLILTPTRELAIQVSKAVTTYGKPVGVEVLSVYGGTGFSDQIRSIRRGVDVIVATPGRALDLVRQGKLPLDTVTTVVLDEADEMLDMGFAEDIEAILSSTPTERQTMLFSATMPPRIEEIAKKHLRNPVRIQVAREKPASGEEAKVRQTAYQVRREHKLAALRRILAVERPTSAIIFCQTRVEADELTESLDQGGFKPTSLHGGMSQEQRDRVMKRFRSGDVDLLIATDIAARGLDISHLSHVINFDLPQQPEAYVHRIGRVGRAGRTGVAITLVSPRDQGSIPYLERMTGQKIELATVPTSKQLKAARLEKTKQLLREAIGQVELEDELCGMIGELEKEFPLKDIALAAVKLLSVPSPEESSPDVPVQRELKQSQRPLTRDFSDRRGDGRGTAERQRAGNRQTSRGMAKVFFGIGRDCKVTARDLVGAITNEAGVPGKDLGVIDVTDRFSLVEVPSDVADYVVEAMQGTRIRGRKVNVRPDRPPRR